MLHHDDLVSVADRAQPMRHDNDSLLAALNELVQRLLHQVLGFSVQGRRGLV